jgi:hypothetical protein
LRGRQRQKNPISLNQKFGPYWLSIAISAIHPNQNSQRVGFGLIHERPPAVVAIPALLLCPAIWKIV